MENSPYPLYWQVGWNFQSITCKSAGRMDFFLEKNKQACPFIREVRVITHSKSRIGSDKVFLGEIQNGKIFS